MSARRPALRAANNEPGAAQASQALKAGASSCSTLPVWEGDSPARNIMLASARGLAGRMPQPLQQEINKRANPGRQMAVLRIGYGKLP